MRLDAKTLSLLEILIAYYTPALKEEFSTLMKGEKPTLPDDLDPELREAVETVQLVLDGQRALYLGSVIQWGEEALTKTQQRRLRYIRDHADRIRASAEYQFAAPYRFVWVIQDRLRKLCNETVSFPLPL